MVVHPCHPSTEEAEVEESLASDQLRLQGRVCFQKEEDAFDISKGYHREYDTWTEGHDFWDSLREMAWLVLIALSMSSTCDYLPPVTPTPKRKSHVGMKTRLH